MKTLVLGLATVLVLSVSAVTAQAQAARAVSGNGSGSFRCEPSSPPVSPTLITFTASVSQGAGAGTYRVVFGNPMGFINGAITGGHINHNNYRLDGLESVNECISTINPVSIPSVITGQCGTGGPITFEEAIGQGKSRVVLGTFSGDVVCT